MIQIISSLIEASAAILAAFVAAGYISKSFEKNITPLFGTYLDEKHDVHKMMRLAEESIYIVAGVGDRFLKKYENELESYLEKGVKIRFLIEAPNPYYEFEHYINPKKRFDVFYYFEVRNSALEILKRMKGKNAGKYADLIEVREFPFFLTASYIGIDIEKSDMSSQWAAHAVIQVMLYQYNVEAGKSPITYFSFKNNKRLFESTADSILEMWNDGKKVDLS